MRDDQDVTTARLQQHADAAERARKAWAARVVGATWAQAASVAGFSDASNCHRAVREYFGTVPAPDSDERRELWRERLEHLWKQSVTDTRQQRPGAVRAGVAVAQRAAALDGLDAPAQAVVYTPRAEEIERYVAHFAARSQAETAELEADVLGDDDE